VTGCGTLGRRPHPPNVAGDPWPGSDRRPFRARTNSHLRLLGQDRRTVLDRLPPVVGVTVVVLAALRLLHVEALRRWEGLARTEEMPVMRGSGQAFRAGQGEGTERGFQPVNGGALDQSTWGATFGGGRTLEAGEVRVRRSQAELRGERRLLASIQLPSGSTTCGTPAATWRPPPGRAPRNRWRGWALDNARRVDLPAPRPRAGSQDGSGHQRAQIEAARIRARAEGSHEANGHSRGV
jgi:hypothetical protein